MLERLSTIFATAILGLVAACGLFVTALIIRWSPLWSQEAAGWAQAIGSLLAIAVAIWVPHRLHSADKEHQRQAPLFALRAILDRASFLIDGAPSTRSNCREMVVAGFAETLAYREYRDVLNALNAFPISTLQEYAAIEAVFEMQSALTKMCTIVEPIDALDDFPSRREAIIDVLQPIEECQEATAKAMVSLQSALDGAGIK